MGYDNSKSVRFQRDLQLSKLRTSGGDGTVKYRFDSNGNQIFDSSNKYEEEVDRKSRKSLKVKVLSRVFSEDYERVRKKILDPQGPAIRRWNKIFLAASLVALYVDPLFFFLPVVSDEECINIDIPLQVILTIVRSIADIFYIVQIFIRFRTAYVAPSSRVFGRGELVIDSSKIASRYLHNNFWIDLIAALPLHQVLIWVIIPNLRGSTMTNTKNLLRFFFFFQYLPRLFLTFPLSSGIINAAGAVRETAWAGAAYNMILYILASHALGCCWYLLSIERIEACWRSVCDSEKPSCQYGFFDCHSIDNSFRDSWFISSNITAQCDPSSNFYLFGIYGDAVTFNVTTAPFINKYFFCLWWGLRNMSCLGQNLITSTYTGEVIFAIIVGTIGLVLFVMLIGNIKTYLQSTTVHVEEWRIKRTDTEEWMHHRLLPQELRQSIWKYDQHKWVATQGVDEETVLKCLPLDLRRGIKSHLCLDLVRRVPLFDQMDERMLDTICERLKPALCTEGTFLVREGDPVKEMLFVIRGHFYSYTTDGGRIGFFNSCHIGPGDFCGEELLTLALDPRPRDILPSSTRTVKAISEVEAFALQAEDMKFVAAQFRRLHSKQLRHKFRFYSHQWRLWAACFIQAAWRQFKRRKEAFELKGYENTMDYEPESPESDSGLFTYAAWLAPNSGSGSGVVGSLQKPAEPDFSADEE